METNDIKTILFKQCEQFVNERLGRIQDRIQGIQQSLNSETKSTAGDKHETGRAMLQLEREKVGQQLAEVQKLVAILCKIEVLPEHTTFQDQGRIRLGSLVFTDQANYFISISAGVLKHKEDSFYAIATNTPIGILLIGKEKGETIVFKGKKITIMRVL
ncbi:3-oxoacyl-ACP synthase [Sungkyunkwania multivorans]|uniref:3-oxoacyl-ACP synthase n=1 Tax=Sungkyunkwania multivorans TaxID=1173618 RepID=A0ABW3CZG4_9FLAO